MIIDQAYKLRNYYAPSSIKGSKQLIISIISGKGGTGKSFLAFYLSQVLAMNGYKTLLVEFDFNLGSLAFMLGANPDVTIGDFFSGSALFEELPVEIDDNFFLIFGDSGKLNFPENRITHIRNFFHVLQTRANNFDFIILDNGAGISKEIFETLKHSSLNLIVTLTEPIAIMDAYVIIKLMIKNSPPIEKGLIINKCKSHSEGETAFENLNKAANHFFKEKLNLFGIVSENSCMGAIQLLNKNQSKLDEKHQVVSELNSTASAIIKFAQLANSRHSKI